jgi:hypothetical protein
VTRAMPCPFARLALSPDVLVVGAGSEAVAVEAATPLSEGSDELHLIEMRSVRFERGGDLMRWGGIELRVDERTERV